MSQSLKDMRVRSVNNFAILVPLEFDLFYLP